MFLGIVVFLWGAHFAADHSGYPIDCYKNPAFTCEMKLND